MGLLAAVFLSAALAAEPVAVVELFTSQGCSSCPPADALLTELHTGHDDEPVYLLSMHVDYWDRLGWPDPWAKAVHSERQRAYGKQLGSVYTPQMVVNGRVGFVGSERARARAEIAKALTTPAKVALEASAERRARTVTVSWMSKEAVEGIMIAALVEDGVETKVKRGENAGRTLAHSRVVRALSQERVAGDSGTIVVEVPVGSRASEVVIYLQDPASLAVLGATRVTLDS